MSTKPGELQHANSGMGDAVAGIAKEIIGEHRSKHSRSRANELENSLRIALRKLANRIDRGYHIEVRTGLLPHLTEEAALADREARVSADAIRKAAKALEFIRLEGDPILSLPEAGADELKSPSAEKIAREDG